MYGIVNKAIEELVIENFGMKKWEAIKKTSGINVDYFISTEPYDDDITYKLAGAVSTEMNITLSQVLIAFGEWWILKTGKEKYGSLLATGGSNLRAFLIYLPDFHTRVLLMYPKLSPPYFLFLILKKTIFVFIIIIIELDYMILCEDYYNDYLNYMIPKQKLNFFNQD